MKNNRRGFTFLEFVIITALVGVVALMAVVNYSQQKPIRDLDSAKVRIVSLLREASSNALNQSRGTSWGVRFEYSSSTTGSFAALFWSSYASNTVVRHMPLPPTLSFNTSTFFWPNFKILEFNFSQLTGKPDYPGPVIIYVKENKNKSSTIIVDSTGLISY